jgi:transposase
VNKIITSFVGLDVHKDSIAMGVAPIGREPPRFVGTVGPQWSGLCKALGRLGRRQELQIVYEAGPCGYTLARELRSHGYACELIAPAKIARRPGDRIKTDRRDALLLARAARAGELVNVTIPDERDEALRDLSRSREDAVRARLKARQQLKALLLRHGHRYTRKSSWTAAHERYLAGVSYVGIRVMIPDTRARQPRDGQMKCGNQPADISMIHRRRKCSRLACPLRC